MQKYKINESYIFHNSKPNLIPLFLLDMGVRPTRKQRIKKRHAKRRTTKKYNKRRHHGGNYEKDVTVGEYDGEPMKSPNTVTVAHGGQVMSVSALLNKLNDFILHGPDY